MKKIITCRHTLQDNMGGPSLLHGTYEILKEIYGKDFIMINLQIGEIPEKAEEDMPFKSFSVDTYSVSDYFQALYLGRRITAKKGISISEALNLIKNADMVIDVYAIAFCDNLGVDNRRKRVLWPLYFMLEFPFSAAAKKYGIRSIKVPSSFGPAQSIYNKKNAVFCNKYVFDYMMAREVESQRFMWNLGIKEIEVVPDFANFMKLPEKTVFKEKRVGISTSHQIIRQWHSSEEYVNCIVELCVHLKKTMDAEVILIPNEISPENNYNDMDVSEEIAEEVKDRGGNVNVLETSHMTSSEIKKEIAECDVLIASRYHSCVAALSSGIPLLVLGWHYKYDELMKLYGQDKWILSEDDCTSEKLINKFDEFYSQKEIIRKEICKRYPIVKKKIIEEAVKAINI